MEGESKCLAISSKKQIHRPKEFKAIRERSSMLVINSESWKFLKMNYAANRIIV